MKKTYLTPCATIVAAHTAQFISGSMDLKDDADYVDTDGAWVREEIIGQDEW